MWLQDLAIGALASGVNTATLVVLNASLLGCIGCLVFLLLGAASSQSWLAPHLAFLLVLAIALWLTVNWFVIQLGTTPPEQQRSELFGDSTSPPLGPANGESRVRPAAAQQQGKKQE